MVDHVSRCLGRYPESLMKIGHDLAEKKFVPGLGLGSGRGWVFSKFKDRFKPIKSHNHCTEGTPYVVAVVDVSGLCSAAILMTYDN